MDDLLHGTRNKRGDWAPRQRLELAPFWTRRVDIAKVARWLVGYVWPWNLIVIATAVLWRNVVVPDAAVMRTLSSGRVLPLLAANVIGIFCFYGAFELRYYIRRVQGQRFKYNGKFPADHPSDVFRFRSQNLDNALRSLLVGVPIGTAIEVLLLWAFANGAASSVAWAEHPAYLIALVLAAPVVHEVHFFFVHRALHWGPLYRWVHSVHHNSVNPSPWSSLSMHPVEMLVYFGVAFWALVAPSHPFLVVFSSTSQASARSSATSASTVSRSASAARNPATPTRTTCTTSTSR